MEDYKVRIRVLRKVNGYNQTQIANYLHVCQRTYSDYETGVIRIPVDCLIRLAKYYDVSMDYICGVSNKQNKFPEE